MATTRPSGPARLALLLAAFLLMPAGGAAQVPTAPLPFVAIDPCRIVDTRGNGFAGPFGPPSLATGVPRDFPLAGQCGLPPEARAASLNVTATNTLGPGFFLLHPAGGATPLVSTLNYLGGETVANAALVPLGPDGLTVIAGVSGADLILDVNGYFVDAGVLAPVTFRGAWAGGTPYGVNDLVSFGGQTFVSLVDGNTGNPPNTSPGQWALFTGSFDAGGGTFQVTTGGTTQVSVTPTGALSLTGNLTLPAASSATAGTILKSASRFLHNAGTGNTFLGVDAGNFTTTGSGGNTGLGVRALQSITTGSGNTATGNDALSQNATGVLNTATGSCALCSNQAGHHNTATGFHALQVNTAGIENTATGSDALRNTTGNNNTAVGRLALFGNTSGSGNTALGDRAGSSATTGSNNIYIANLGVAAESGTIRIGSGSQTQTFIAGINGAGVDQNVAVLVGTDGKLGTVVPSSRRFKTDIQDLGDASRGLLGLRPVVFRYTREFAPSNPTRQYGLIAEEVAEIYPELVVRDDDGRPTAVFYHVLPVMLLNELQRQQREIQDLRRRLEALEGHASAGR